MQNKTARIRTIQQCLVEIKSIDRESAITENFIRTLCKDNKVRYFKSGVKYLVNLDNLLEYLGYTTGGGDNG